jgi:hypothetical protein
MKNYRKPKPVDDEWRENWNPDKLKKSDPPDEISDKLVIPNDDDDDDDDPPQDSGPETAEALQKEAIQREGIFPPLRQRRPREVVLPPFQPIDETCSRENNQQHEKAAAKEEQKIANRCPAGGRFGVDISNLNECNNCGVFKKCSLECQKIEGDVPDGTELPQNPIPEQPRSKPPEPKKGRQCHQRNPLKYDCKNCRKLPDCRAYLGWFATIPHFILDDYLMKLSGSAVKIFLLLSKTVSYHPGSNYFGRCWLTYDQIKEATGVATSHMGEYMKELTGHGLIEHVQTRQNTDGKWKIINQFTVTWYRCLLQIEDKRKRHTDPKLFK